MFISKLRNILLFLFLLLIPTQLGRHFWPEWSYVLGIRVDYLSPVLYLVDIIWILLLISNIQFPIFNIKKYFNFKEVYTIGNTTDIEKKDEKYINNCLYISKKIFN